MKSSTSREEEPPHQSRSCVRAWHCVSNDCFVTADIPAGLSCSVPYQSELSRNAGVYFVGSWQPVLVFFLAFLLTLFMFSKKNFSAIKLFV